jgi:hypothetical protein
MELLLNEIENLTFVINGLIGFSLDPRYVESLEYIWCVVKNNYPKYTLNEGKWLIFLNEKDISTHWIIFCKELYKGNLGSKIKCSTKKSFLYYKNYVIQIYTYNSDDEIDVFRIGNYIKSLGYNNIKYKTEKMTKKGIYSSNYKNISKYLII